MVTGGALVALILALQPVSAAFNPVVTLVERAFGAITSGAAVALVAAQMVGGFVGAVVANLMFDLSAVDLSTHHRSGGGVLLGRGRRHARLARRHLRHRALGPLRSRRLRRRRLHPGRLLVHQLDVVRQPRRHHRPDVLQHLRRHRPGVGRAVRRDATRRRPARLRADPRALPEHRGSRCPRHRRP